MKTVGVIDQIRLAARHPLPALFGAAMGAVVPVLVFHVVHGHIDRARPLSGQPLAYMVLGGLAFSAVTVYQWAALAFGVHPNASPIGRVWARMKAAGFVVLLEGVMVFAPGWLPAVCLAYLVAINAIATAAHLAIGDRVSRRRTRVVGRKRARRSARPTAKPAPTPAPQTSLAFDR